MMTQSLMISNKNLHKSVFEILIVTLVSVIGLAGCDAGLSGDENASDPVVIDNPVVFIKRPLQFDEDEPTELATVDIRLPAEFNPGAVLYIKDRAAPTASVRDLTSAVFSGPSFLNDDGELLYDVKDLDVSFDGRKLLFAMRAPEIEDADDEDQPKWNIWEYDVDSNALRRVIAGNFEAEDGHDIAPTYLPDGRILFSSTRQRRSKAILLDEGKPQYSAQNEARTSDNFVLHVMEADGTNIQQLTFNQSHDLDPVVMSDGTIVFSRWDNAGGSANNGVNLYRINPDGSGLTYLYGRHSHVDGDRRVHFVKPYEAESGNVVVQLRELQSTPTQWQPTEVDVRNYVELNVGINGATGQGHFPVVDGVVNEGDLSLTGVYGSAFPLYDGSSRYLASWSACRLVPADPLNGTAPVYCTQERIDSGAYVAAPPLFGLWIVDVNAATQLPIELQAVEGQQFDEAVLMTSRALPDSYPPMIVGNDEQALADTGYGILHIRSVYDFAGVAITPDIATLADPLQTPPANRARRFVRIEKPVSLPSREVRDFDNSAIGAAGNQLMREILGYAPIEPDGSVKVAVPANVAFGISVLNADGERISARHLNWMQLMPGETIECNGCHTDNSTVPHGRPDAEPAPLNAGAVTTGVAYPNSEPGLSPDMGNTMAETWAIWNGIRLLTPDIIYQDDWTDDDIVPKAASFDYSYGDLTTPIPLNPTCEALWSSLCRITINYPQHIDPLWSVDRRVFDVDGVTVLTDRTCTSCHTSEMDDGMGGTTLKIADAHLDLTDGESDQEPDHLKSYRELLFNDNEQEIVGGILVDILQGTGVFVPVLDGDGNPVLDGDGNPVEIELTATITVTPSMSSTSARTGRFIGKFTGAGSHAGDLTPAELKLIREWLDIGAQYYNNPFDPGVPVN